MPNRIVRESILTSDKVDQLDAAVEVFYRRLMSVVDDFGRFDARPLILKAACFPLKVDRIREADIPRWLATCQKAGLIVLYEVTGKPYLELLNLEDRRRAKHSKYPAPSENQHAGTCAQVTASASNGQHMRPNAHSDAHSDSKDAADAAVLRTAKGVEIPFTLQNPDFLEAWKRWESHLRKKGVKRTDQADEGQIAKCVEWGSVFAIECINHSIAGSYQGLFPPSKKAVPGDGRNPNDPPPGTSAQSRTYGVTD